MFFATGSVLAFSLRAKYPMTSVHATSSSMPADLEPLVSAGKQAVAKVSATVDGFKSQRAQNESNNIAAGLFSGAVLGILGAGAYRLARPIVKVAGAALGVLAIIQVLATSFLLYKEWITVHWERVFSDNRFYARSRWERFKAACVAHWPLRVGFAFGLVGTLCAVTAFKQHRKNQRYQSV
jgi:hypothetical protein